MLTLRLYGRTERFDELADRLELATVGALGPFEEDGLGGGHDGPSVLEAAEGELPVDPRSRADGVGRDLDPEAEVEQLERRLRDADVRLDADQGDVLGLPSVELL